MGFIVPGERVPAISGKSVTFRDGVPVGESFRRIARGRRAVSDPLVEGVDYYVENGLFVFTAKYLQERGYCCESGCRHCPWGYVTEKCAQRRRAELSSDGATSS